MIHQLDLSDGAIWKQRFRATSILSAQTAALSPDRGMVATNKDGVFQLYAWDVKTGNLRQITNQPAGVVAGMLSEDGDFIYYLHDDGGNEIGHYVRAPFGGGVAEDITPDMPSYASHRITQSRDGTTTAFMTAGDGGYRIFLIRGDSPPEEVFKAGRIIRGFELSTTGDILAVNSTEHSGSLDARIVTIDTTTGRVIGELEDGDGSSVEAVGFSPAPGDDRLLVSTTRTGFQRPLVWHPVTGVREDLAIDAVPGVVSGWGWDPDGSGILLCQLNMAQYQLYHYTFAGHVCGKLDHPAGVLGGRMGGGWITRDGEIITTWQDPATPPRLIALDARTGRFLRTVLAAGDSPAGQPWRSFVVEGANGDIVQGWVATPEGEGPFPTIFHTHGGPTAVQTAVFTPECQAWLDHGFAWATINYHGSPTFGTDFEKSIWGNLGDLEVQDMVAAHGWLVEHKVAIPDKVFLTGGSYGGYLTLQAIGRAPEYWAGGMGVVAIGDWFLMYEDQAPTLQGYQRALFGGKPSERPEAHRAASPITYADQIRAPLLVIQGKNDTRCPSRQMEAYETRLKELGKSITIDWFDAGHGSRAQEEQIRQTELKLKFAYSVLKG